MSLSVIRLAIAKKYFEKNKSLNYNKVIVVTLYPDVANDNDKSHYKDLNRGSDNVSHVRENVNLYEFLKEHEILSDFEVDVSYI